jgi:hypothetical protein
MVKAALKDFHTMKMALQNLNTSRRALLRKANVLFLRARRRTPTLREIADRLAQADHLATTGKPYAPSVVARVLRT